MKFGAPHFVDFGKNLEHSPDGKAYIVGHGASKPDSIQAWMLGDEVYLARADATPEAMEDGSYINHNYILAQSSMLSPKNRHCIQIHCNNDERAVLVPAIIILMYEPSSIASG